MPKSPEFDPTVNYYRTLGVPESASAEDIKRSYRALAKELHPDSNGGDQWKEARFKDIAVAYAVIGDADKRRQYDDVRRPWPWGSSLPPHQARQGRGASADLDGIGDLLEMFYRTTGYQKTHPGAGASGHHDESTRNGSHGHGHRQRARDEREREMERERERERERGRRDRQPRRITASDGSMLAVDGQDVSSEIRISFDRAITGTVAQVATIDGTLDVKIPPGTSSGRMLRLRGKGIDGADGFGDHYVTVQIDVPELADADDPAAALLTQLVAALRRPR